MADGRRALRIGIDARDLGARPTGVGRYVRSLLRRWSGATHRFVLYSDREPAAPDARNVETRVLTAAHRALWAHHAWPRAMTRDRIDVAFCPAYASPLGWRGPSVTTLHDVSFCARPEEFGFLQGLALRFFARRSAAASRALITESDFSRREIGRLLGDAALAKTVVILNGTDDDLPRGPSRHEARRRLGLNEADKLIITVGSIFPRRNLNVLVAAVAEAKARVPGARLDIVGDDRSNGRIDIAGDAARAGVSGSVTLSGYLSDEDLAVRYAAADAAAFLSEYEGFGLPALEALARGVPTLIGNRPSQSELFGDGALVVEPRDAAAVADGLARILTDPSEAARLRAAGAMVAARFSWTRAAEETLRVIERAAGADDVR